MLILFGAANVFFMTISIVGSILAIISGIIGLVKKKPFRKKGLWGLLMGIAVLAIWAWVIISVGEW